MSCETLLNKVTPEEFLAWASEAREDCPGTLWQSGIVRRSEMLDNLALGSSCSFTAGGWTLAGTGPNRSNGSFEAHAAYDCDACDEPVGKQFKMSQIDRQKCYFDRDAQNDCNIFSGSTTDQIAQLFSNWTVDVRETDLIASMVGIYLDNIANDGGDLVVDADDAAQNAADPGYYSLSAQTGLKTKFGCKSSMMGGVLMHPVVANHLSETNQLTEIAAGSASSCDASCIETRGMFNGKPVMVWDDDSLIMADGRFLSICFKDGAFGYGEGRRVTPFERDRDVCADGGEGAWKSIMRERYILHPMGWNFEPTLQADQKTPAPADLANPDSWCRTVNQKNSGLGFVISSQQ